MVDLVKSEPQQLSAMTMKVRELDAMGRATEYLVPIPDKSNFAEWSFYQQIAMLKAGAWEKIPVSQVIYAIAYAEKQGLDIMQGDVYSTGDGRIAISNKAKIKLALKTGRICGIKVETIETEDPLVLEGCAVSHELECTVTLKVKGFDEPVVKIQRLSEWYMPRNPNWKFRPQHMLELNTLAHACEIVHPTVTEGDEAPPLVESISASGTTQALKEAGALPVVEII